MLIGIGVASVVKAAEDPRKYFDVGHTVYGIL